MKQDLRYFVTDEEDEEEERAEEAVSFIPVIEIDDSVELDEERMPDLEDEEMDIDF